MAISIQTLQWMRTLQVDTSSVLTLGRQAVLASRSELRTAFGTDDPLAWYTRGMWADELFMRVLGSHVIDSVDASGFEGATITADLNYPVEFKRHYSLVADFGTLEHVFNFPDALRSCLNAVEIGGHFVAITPANNLCGHGFYQFSPELFMALLPLNGFVLHSCVLIESSPRGRWFEALQPRGETAKLVTSFPVTMAISAKKVRDTPKRLLPPNQSAFTSQWSGEAFQCDRLSGMDKAKTWMLENMPRLSRWIEGWRSSALNPDWSFRGKHFLRIR